MLREPFVAAVRSDRFRIVRDNFLAEETAQVCCELRAQVGNRVRPELIDGRIRQHGMSTKLDRDAIMPSLLHSRDERFGFWKNHWLTCLGASKFRHRIHGIEAE